MAPKIGDTVRVHYTGTLGDGSQFDSSVGREPLEFQLGAGQVIPGFDAAVVGLEVGESVTLTIPAEEAYGPHHADGIQQIPMSVFPSPPEVDWVVELGTPDGQQFSAKILDVAPEFVTVDLNHPLAGEDLTFEIELVQVGEV